MIAFVLWLALAPGAAPVQTRAPKARPTPPPAAAPAAVVQAPSSTRVEDSCECETQRPTTLAIVNGFKIPTADVEQFTAQDVAAIRGRMDAARAQGLQSLVNQRLLEQEAKRRGLTPTQFVQSEVYEKIGDPTDDEVRTFFERNRVQLQGEYEQNREKLAAYMRAQREGIQITLLTEGLRSTIPVQVLDAAPAAPATPEERSKVVATVGDTKITLGDVEGAVRPALFQARRQIYEIEKLALDLMIDRAIVEQEAQRRGMTGEAFLAAEVAPKAHKVDAFDAAKFYNENKDQFGGRQLAEVREDIIGFLQQAANVRALHDYAEPLRKAANVQVFLVEPAPPNYVIDVAGRPAKGAASAPVTIVEFSDFQCPKCALAFKSLEEVVKTYDGKVRVVARHFPLEQHLFARKAAEAAEAAHEQGKFWEYAGLLYQNQKDLSVEKLKELATQAGLDRGRFDAALDSGKFAPVVERDASDGMRISIPGTPALFVNGQLLFDDSPAGIKAAVDAVLAGGK